MTCPEIDYVADLPDTAFSAQGALPGYQPYFVKRNHFLCNLPCWLVVDLGMYIIYSLYSRIVKMIVVFFFIRLVDFFSQDREPHLIVNLLLIIKILSLIRNSTAYHESSY